MSIILSTHSESPQPPQPAEQPAFGFALPQPAQLVFGFGQPAFGFGQPAFGFEATASNSPEQIDRDSDKLEMLQLVMDMLISRHLE